jgi:small conductance mechanosensitive channel
VSDADQRLLEIGLLIVLPAIVGYLASRWLGDEAKRRGSTPGVVRGIRILTTVVWAAIVVFGVSLVLGPVSFLSTLTVSAIAGIAATLALQTTLQNIVAGFILLQRGFLRVGDVVAVSGVKGTVVSLGLVDTVIMIEDGTLAFLSNSTLLNGPLLNPTASERLRGEY